MSEILHIPEATGGNVRLVRVHARSRSSRVAAECPPVPEETAGRSGSTDVSGCDAPVHCRRNRSSRRVSQAYRQGRGRGTRSRGSRIQTRCWPICTGPDRRTDRRLARRPWAKQLRQLGENLERDAYQFALAVAARIIKREVTLDNDTILRQIKGAIRRVVGVETIKLRVHPADEELLCASIAGSFLSSAREHPGSGDRSG